MNIRKSVGDLPKRWEIKELSRMFGAVDEGEDAIQQPRYSDRDQMWMIKW